MELGQFVWKCLQVMKILKKGKGGMFWSWKNKRKSQSLHLWDQADLLSDFYKALLSAVDAAHFSFSPRF